MSACGTAGRDMTFHVSSCRFVSRCQHPLVKLAVKMGTWQTSALETASKMDSICLKVKENQTALHTIWIPPKKDMMWRLVQDNG